MSTLSAVIVSTETAIERRELLGLPVAVRAIFSALDAGYETIEVLGNGAQELIELAARSGITTFTPPQIPRQGDYLIVRADALIASTLLTSLEPGDAICSEDGTRVAGRICLAPGDDPLGVLQNARPKPWTRDRYRFAIHLSDERAYNAAERLLLASMVKPSDGPVSRHFNRRISLTLTRLLVRLGVTPNQVTVIVALLGLAAAWLATYPTWLYQLAGAAFFQLHSIIDGCDGEIARLTRRFGKYGSFIDSAVDDLSNVGFFVALSIGVARALDVSWPLVTAGVTVFGYAGTAAIQYWFVNRATGRGDKTRFWESEQRALSRLTGVLNSLLRRDVFVALILFAVTVGLGPIAVAVFPLAAVGALAASILQVKRGR
ncbi:MAG: CDP-alcohol phosphatidyltransferase family protein [Deltaproteobacteria bacterium]|nr:CDP-alcohol phosphatidyltransferase family protein [Deltaproteobacteria bacterium]